MPASMVATGTSAMKQQRMGWAASARASSRAAIHLIAKRTSSTAHTVTATAMTDSPIQVGKPHRREATRQPLPRPVRPSTMLK